MNRILTVILLLNIKIYSSTNGQTKRFKIGGAKKCRIQVNNLERSGKVEERGENQEKAKVEKVLQRQSYFGAKISQKFKIILWAFIFT